MTKKEQTASMMAKKSRVEIVICCGGGVEVLGLAGLEGSVGIEGIGVVGTGVVIAGG